MQARWTRATAILALTGLALASLGCAETAPRPASSVGQDDPPSSNGNFQSENCGTIHGRVTWRGPAPTVPPLRAQRSPTFVPAWPADQGEKLFANPNAPVIGPDGGVGNAVVYLRGIDPRQARPWDHDPVTVAFAESELLVEQGLNRHQTGFVYRGMGVGFESRECRHHAARARGAAFFTLMLPEPGHKRFRQLNQNGVVEISSAADYFWLRSYLFVDEHPYYTRTNAQGDFRLDQVPPGEYELVAWLPNWHESGQDRNPESMHVSRLFFRPPVEQVGPVHVRSGAATAIEFSFTSANF